MADEGFRQLLEKAVERRNELAREAAALDSLIALYTRSLSRRSTESRSDSEQPDLYLQPSRRAMHAAQIAEMLDAARRIIIAEKRPMKRGELVKRLSQQGFEFIGKDKNKVFGTNIWRSGRFRTIDDKGYWPKDVTLPK